MKRSPNPETHTHNSAVECQRMGAEERLANTSAQNRDAGSTQTFRRSRTGLVVWWTDCCTFSPIRCSNLHCRTQYKHAQILTQTHPPRPVLGKRQHHCKTNRKLSKKNTDSQGSPSRTARSVGCFSLPTRKTNRSALTQGPETGLDECKWGTANRFLFPWKILFAGPNFFLLKWPSCSQESHPHPTRSRNRPWKQEWEYSHRGRTGGRGAR